MLNTLMIDYVSCTFKNLSSIDIDSVMEYLAINILKIPLDYFAYYDYGYNKYNCHFAYNEIKIYFKRDFENPNQYIVEQGVFLELKGQACRQIEEFFSTNFSWPHFLRKCYEHYAKFTRFDLANDIYDRTLNIQQIKSFADKGLCVTRVKTKIYYEETEANSQNLYGNSITFGKRGNDGRQWCVYNKLLEQNKTSTQYSNGWIRSELRLFGDSAQSGVNYLIEKQITLNDFFFQTLSDFIRFVSEECTDKNIRRRPITKWWSDYLQTQEKIHLKTTKEKRTMLSTETFINKQAKKSLGMIYSRDKIAYGEEKALENLVSLAKNGESKMTIDDMMIVQQSALEKTTETSYIQRKE